MRSRYVAMRGTTSGGTIKTGVLLKQKYAREYNEPYLLSSPCVPPFRGPSAEQQHEEAVAPSAWERDLESAEWDAWALATKSTAGIVAGAADDNSGIWTAPFTMARINTRVVRRSDALFRQGRDGPAGAGYDGGVVAASDAETAEEIMAARAARTTVPTSPDFQCVLVRAIERYLQLC